MFLFFKFYLLQVHQSQMLTLHLSKGNHFLHAAAKALSSRTPEGTAAAAIIAGWLSSLTCWSEFEPVEKCCKPYFNNYIHSLRMLLRTHSPRKHNTVNLTTCGGGFFLISHCACFLYAGWSCCFYFIFRGFLCCNRKRWGCDRLWFGKIVSGFLWVHIEV